MTAPSPATAPFEAGQGGVENPPAFPMDHRFMLEGMSLRDWFAGQALAGIIGNSASGLAVGTSHPDGNTTVAVVAYVLADAMLAERAKGGAA